MLKVGGWELDDSPRAGWSQFPCSYREVPDLWAPIITAPGPALAEEEPGVLPLSSLGYGSKEPHSRYGPNRRHLECLLGPDHQHLRRALGWPAGPQSLGP